MVKKKKIAVRRSVACAPQGERRGSRRFALRWDVEIRGRANEVSGGGPALIENLSSSGAFIRLGQSLNVGATLSLCIKVPFRNRACMHYSAEVIRVESDKAAAGVAVRFKTFRPVFGEQ